MEFAANNHEWIMSRNFSRRADEEIVIIVIHNDICSEIRMLEKIFFPKKLLAYSKLGKR